MVDTTTAALLPFLPLLWAFGASILWWRQLSQPWLFAVTALLSLVGIQQLISLASDLWPFLPLTGAGIRGVTREEMQSLFDQQHRIAVIQAVVVLVIAVPFLLWLRNGLMARPG